MSLQRSFFNLPSFLVNRGSLTSQVVTPFVYILVFMILFAMFTIVQGLKTNKQQFEKVLSQHAITAYSIFTGSYEQFSTITLALRSRQEMLIDLQVFDNYQAMNLLINEISGLYNATLVAVFSQGKMVSLSRAGDVVPDDLLHESQFNTEELSADTVLTVYPLSMLSGNGEDQGDVLCLVNLVQMIDASGDEALSVVSVKRLDTDVALFNKIARLSGGEALLLDSDKEVILSSFGNDPSSFVWLDREHFEFGEERYKTLEKVLSDPDGDRIGYLSVAVNEATFIQQQQRTLLFVLIPFVALLFIFFLFYRHIKYRVINKIMPLIDGLRSVADGKLDTRLNVSDERPKDANEIAMMQQNFNLMVEQLEQANEELMKLAITDGLTGLHNRRRFDDVLQREYERHLRSEKEIAVVLLDIDHFKPFNDHYGHPEGDACLRKVSAAIHQTIHRHSDLCARYGGEEFACVLVETGAKGALVVAEKIRQNIESLSIPHQWSSVSGVVTVSVGVCVSHCTTDDNSTSLVQQADEQLYLAKKSGRNSVSLIDKTTEDE